jgi:two-component system, NarL family, nitrate/nitrite response regulator NarL
MAACGKRILVVDQDARFRASVVSLVQGAGYEAISAGSGEEALFLARTESPHLAILDVELPGISGYEVCRRLREDVHAIGIVFVSDTRTDSLDRAAGLLIGADDYLAKPFAPDELLARIRPLLARNGVEHAPARPAPVALEAALTAREQEVLRLLADGLSQGGIAERLVISPKTVAAHIDHILGKLGVHSRAEAVAVAYRDGHVSV